MGKKLSSTICIRPILSIIFFTIAFFAQSFAYSPGSALKFDGNDDYAIHSPVVTTITDNLTIEAWVNWVGAGADQLILYNGNTAHNGYGIYVNGSNGDVGIILGNVITTCSNLALPTNTWTHVAEVSSGGVWTMYVNGVPATTFTNGNTWAPYTPDGGFEIGGPPYGTAFNGTIDEVRVWNVARSQADINNSMHICFSSAQPGLIAYYQLNEGSGTIAHDLVGGNDLTLTNFNFDATDGWVSSTIPPPTPQNLAAIAGNGKVILKWNKNMESDFLKYRIYMGSDSLSLNLEDSTSASLSDTCKTITGLTNETKYFFRVSALDSARLESSQSYAAVGIPNASIVPAGLVAWYPFNSSPNDSSGNGNNGTIYACINKAT